MSMDKHDRGYDRNYERGDRDRMEFKRVERERSERMERIEEGAEGKDRKVFAKKRSCWFCSKGIEPDWKETDSYSWLVNEFGKVSPARVTGLCLKHQRHSNAAIKRGRNMGMISYLSNQVVQ